MRNQQPANSSRLRVRRVRPVVDMNPRGCASPNGRIEWRPALAYQATSVPTASCVYVTEESEALVADTESAELTFEFERSGVVVALVPSVTRKGAFATLDEARAGVGVQCFTGASRALLFTDGDAGRHAQIDALCGGGLERTFNVGLRVAAKDRWRFTFLSTTAGARAKVQLYFREDIGPNNEEDPSC